jgi:hypothetical protein
MCRCHASHLLWGIRFIQWLPGGFTLITRRFSHYELREWKAVVELGDPGDELSGEGHPSLLCRDAEAVMLAAILQSHRRPTVAYMPAVPSLSYLLHLNIPIALMQTHHSFLKLL